MSTRTSKRRTNSARRERSGMGKQTYWDLFPCRHRRYRS
nr:MAG TPA: hypothetical protein [Caudoviricetes sp.]